MALVITIRVDANVNEEELPTWSEVRDLLVTYGWNDPSIEVTSVTEDYERVPR